MKFQIGVTKKDLSPLGGAPIIDEILNTVNFKKLYGDTLPTLKYKGQQDSLLNLKAMACGLMNGCQCLDDMEDQNDDSAYLQLVERSYTPRTYGNFLRSLKPVNILKLQDATIRMNLMLRSQIEGRFIDQNRIREDIMIHDCDATKNR